MQISSVVSVQEMKSFIQDGMTYKSINNLLINRHPTVRGLSVMSIRRFCMKNNIGRKCKLSNEEIEKKVFECVQEVNFIILTLYSNL